MPAPRHLSRFAAAAALVLGPWSLVIPTARSAPEVKATAPVKNFRLPTFTAQGFRHTMVRAEEARLPDPARIDLTEMELTLFTGRADEQIDAMLAAPSASFYPEKLLATGGDTVRVERTDLTLTGADWSYDHAARKVVLKRDAHVIFRSALGDILK
jgi:hypothetical protein